MLIRQHSCSTDDLYRCLDDIIEAGGVEPLKKLFQNHSNKEIQFEAAWSLTNIASGNEAQCQVLIDAGIMPLVVEKIREWNGNPDDKMLIEQSIWCLGNL